MEDMVNPSEPVEGEMKEYMHEILDRVEKPTGNYFAECQSFAMQWISDHFGEEFRSEHIIHDYNMKNQDCIPQEPRVWGAVMRRIVRDGKVLFMRYEPYGRSGHGKPSAVWKSIWRG